MPRQRLFFLLGLVCLAGCRTAAPVPRPVVAIPAPTQESASPPPRPPSPVEAPASRARTVVVPNEATPPVRRPAVEIVLLQPGIWRHSSRDPIDAGTSHGLLVQEQQRLVLVDTPVSADATAELLAWTERELQQPVSRVVLTHADPNGVAGARLLAEKRIPLVALAATASHYATLGGPRATSIGDVAPGGSVRVGLVELSYPGLEHRRDAAVLWLRDANLLYGGAIKPLGSSSLGTLSPRERQVWAAAVRRLMQRFPEATLVVPIEGEPGGADLLHHTLRLLAAASP